MSDNPEKCANYLRVVRFTVDVGTDAVRDLLYYYKARDNIASFFAQRTISDELQQLKRKHIITKEQYERIISCENVDNFDLSLLITLLTNIFAVTIGPPACGWDNPADENDTSIAADLLRLKDIRNTIIGHKSSAQISSEEYKSLWKDLENIFIRIKMVVCGSGESEKSIRTKLEVYRSKALEPTDEIEERYANLIQRWHDEFTTLQNEVERLCERTTEFCLLFTRNIPERYSRYVLILYEGGMLVLTSTLHVKLRKRKTDLISVLAGSRQVLALIVKNAKKVIFETTSKINIDVSTWGLSLLADVILHLFSDDLSQPEKKAIRGIKRANENYAISALASIDGDKFREYWTDIISHINILSILQNEQTHEECQILIKKHDKGHIDETVVKQYLGQLLQDCRPSNSLIELYKDTRRKLKDSIEAMKNKGLKFGKEHEIDLKMMTVGKSDENRKLAENILYTVFQKATSMTDGCDDFQTMKEAVDKILDRIRNMEDVKIKSVEKHCIILTFKSSSATGFLDLIDFTKSEYFFAEIENIGKCLSDHIGEFISVTAFITLESMQQALDILAKNDYGDGESSTHLKLVVSSANAIEKVSRMINDNETENDMNDVAQGISEHLNERISISRSIELEGLGEVFGNPLQCLLHSEWQPFVKSGSRTTHAKFNSSPHLAYLQSLIDDIQRPTEIILPVTQFDDDSDMIHHVPVHRVSSSPTVALRRLQMGHSSDTFDAYDDTNQNNLSNFYDQPVPSPPLYASDTSISGDFIDHLPGTYFNWDFVGTSTSPLDNSSRSSSVCSVAM